MSKLPRTVELIGKVAGAVTAVIVLGTTVYTATVGQKPIVVSVSPSELIGSSDRPDPPAPEPAKLAKATQPSDTKEPTIAALLPEAEQTSTTAPSAIQPDSGPDPSHNLPPPPQPGSPRLSQAQTLQDNWLDGKTLRLFEYRTSQICPDQIDFSFSVAKQGSDADNGIYLISPQSTGRSETGLEITLSSQCRLRLDYTGKTTSFFASFTYISGE